MTIPKTPRRLGLTDKQWIMLQRIDQASEVLSAGLPLHIDLFLHTNGMKKADWLPFLMRLQGEVPFQLHTDLTTTRSTLIWADLTSRRPSPYSARKTRS